MAITAPIPCANRFGGPGTGFLAPSRGAITFCAVQPSGLSVGPVSTRAQNPYVSGISSQYAPVARITSTVSEDDAGDDPSRLLVDGIRKGKQPSHHFQYKRPEFRLYSPP